jgi:hypothetical protein
MGLGTVRGAAGALLAATLSGVSAGPALAGPDEIALLQTFVGSWRGEGTLIGPEDPPSPFQCDLLTRRGNAGKLVFTGNCPLLTAAGGIGYAAAAAQYELAVTSSADFRGAAIGHSEDDVIVFVIEDAGSAKSNDLRLNANMRMRAQEIAITFDAVLNGEPWTGSLTFRR